MKENINNYTEDSESIKNSDKSIFSPLTEQIEIIKNLEALKK